MLADLDTEEDEPDGVKGIGRKKKKLDTFEKLFDISPCKHLSREDCDCPASQKVPAREFSFLLDQRTERQLVIASVDEKVTQAWQEAQQRKGKEEIFLKKEDTRQENVRKDIKRKRKEFLEAQVENDDNTQKDETFVLPATVQQLATEQNRLNISKFVA